MQERKDHFEQLARALLRYSRRRVVLDLTKVLQLLAARRMVAAKPPKAVKAGDWQRLGSIEIHDFKAIKFTRVPLSDVTILVGPNGCGKSSVLQATHWAARAASYIKPKNTKEVVAFDRLDYIPSSQPLRTAHYAELGSGGATTHTKVVFVIETSPAEERFATVKIWAARNRGAISVHIDGGPAVTPFKQREQFLTAYIPGLAGLSERETILAQPLMRRTAASGDAGGVLRNVIYNLAVRQSADEVAGMGDARLKRLNQLVQRIHPNIQLAVGFDEREDIHIDATFFRPGEPDTRRSLEDLATGVLQVVQIFAYLILFRPKILLVDEPDAHLHPDKQERLIEALEEAAEEFQAQIILTTHSQHVVRAASSSTQLVWMRGGVVVAQEEANTRRLMGWGALDKKVLFFVEDEEDEAIRQLLRQWPALHRQISVCRCFGVDNLPKQPMLRGLISEDELDIRVLLHRDRDFLTDHEVQMWRQTFSGLQRVFAWVTKHVDVEAYFCQPAYIQALYGISSAEAQRLVSEATNNIKGVRKLFLDKRTVITRQLYPPHGGSPDSEKLWEDIGGQSPDTVLGKSLHKALKQKLHESNLDPSKLGKFLIPSGFEMAPDLRTEIEAALKA